jgi:hypothetical protein
MSDAVVRPIRADLPDARGRWLPGAVPAGANPWGKSDRPNPTGKGGLYHEMQRMARACTPRLVELLRAIAEDRAENSRNRVVAAGMLLERGWGKPKQAAADGLPGLVEPPQPAVPRDEIDRVLAKLRERFEVVEQVLADMLDRFDLVETVLADTLDRLDDHRDVLRR